jgi:hypothetical protein
MYAPFGAGPYRARARDSPRRLPEQAPGRRAREPDGGICVRKFAGDINFKPIYAVPVVLLVVVAVVLIVVLTGGGDDGEDRGGVTTPRKTDDDDKAKLPKGRRVKEAPRGSFGVIDEARRVGPFAVAQARATVLRPSRVSLRINAAPKQRVSVDWQLSCFLNRRVRVGKGSYRARTPDIRTIPVPMPGAETCIATAGAQLTRFGRGRVKIAVIAG